MWDLWFHVNRELWREKVTTYFVSPPILEGFFQSVREGFGGSGGGGFSRQKCRKKLGRPWVWKSPKTIVCEANVSSAYIPTIVSANPSWTKFISIFLQFWCSSGSGSGDLKIILNTGIRLVDWILLFLIFFLFPQCNWFSYFSYEVV